MPQWIKFISFLFCVAYAVLIFNHRFLIAADNGPIHVVHGRPVVTKPSNLRRTLGTVLLVGSLGGAIVLAIDAYRRDYDEPKALPIVLATMGVFSLGITSIIYYLAWGNNPAKLYQSASTAYCPDCFHSTLDIPAKGLFTVKHIWGVRLIGSSGRCGDCGSIIKTRWFFFVVPLIPFGSFRVLRAGDPSLLWAPLYTRMLPKMNWVQVFARYIILGVIAGVVGLIAWV